MTDVVADAADIPKQIPSTAGMTTKVVKGSMWTLGGSVLPLAVSFVSTPFIIRFLGTESYGVLLLVGLIPTYFSFADFGMGVASTKFASEAYGQGDEDKEAEIVWTATAIAAISALVVAVPIFLFSYSIVAALNVPEHLLSQASIALKITSGSFFLGILSSVLNSPMLARLRMDLNMLTSAVPKILLAVVTPFILYFGGGLLGAVSWAFIVAIGILAVVIYFSARLSPELTSITLNREYIRLLLKFGGGLILATVAAGLLVNFEKLALTNLASVSALAHYSVAFTLANMALLFSASMTQSLIPAFSQLTSSERRTELDSLFSSIIRISLVWLAPMSTILFVSAKPFLHFWAGADFGRESTVPFYILLIGVIFNMLAFIQHSLITSTGRTGLLAKIYWVQLLIFVFMSSGLIYLFGVVGAALAWSLRVIGDSVLFIHLGHKLLGLSFRIRDELPGLIVPLGILVLVCLFAVFIGNNLVINSALAVGGIGVYFVLIWTKYLRETERKWIKSRLGV